MYEAHDKRAGKPTIGANSAKPYISSPAAGHQNALGSIIAEMDLKDLPGTGRHSFSINGNLVEEGRGEEGYLQSLQDRKLCA